MKENYLVIKNIVRDCAERNTVNCVRNYKPGHQRRALCFAEPRVKTKGDQYGGSLFYSHRMADYKNYCSNV